MKAERVAWIAGGVGLTACVLGAMLQPDDFAFAWLSALMVWLRWPLGCLALLLVHTLTGGRWGLPIRPWLLLGVATLPVLLPAIVPVLLQLPRLYPWAQPNAAAHLDNGFYLNLPFAAARWVFYAIVWFGVGGLAAWRLRAGASIRILAAPGLILLGLTTNFASIDALMSLDPHFNSSNFGMTFAAESVLFALSVTILATVLSGPVGAPERDDLGRLLQSMLILWAYLDFMQLLIVWQSNLPKEAAWYLVRSAGLWGFVAALTAVAHFLLPFLALLIPPIRRSQRGIVATTGLLIAMSIVRGWWLVVPAQGRGIGWIDIAAMLAFGGVSVGLMLRAPGLHPLVTHA
jgi:hypothetical protein